MYIKRASRHTETAESMGQLTVGFHGYLRTTSLTAWTEILRRGLSLAPSFSHQMSSPEIANLRALNGVAMQQTQAVIFGAR